MIDLELISPKGDILKLIGNESFVLTEASGITQTSASISSTTVASQDGDFVNNVQGQPRPIELYIRPFPELDVETVKRYILRYVKPKLTHKLRMTHNGRVTVIEGVVEAIDMPRFSQEVIMQISLYCAQPYWEDADYIVQTISELINLHYFPIEMNGLAFPEEGVVMGEYDVNRTKIFVNDGDVAVGMEISIIALDNVINPVLYNSNGEYMGLNYTLFANDIVTINTTKGHKEVMLNGRINLLDKIKPNSTWLQFEVGENEFTIDSDDGTEGNVYFELKYKQHYV